MLFLFLDGVSSGSLGQEIVHWQDLLVHVLGGFWFDPGFVLGGNGLECHIDIPGSHHHFDLVGGHSHQHVIGTVASRVGGGELCTIVLHVSNLSITVRILSMVG